MAHRTPLLPFTAVRPWAPSSLVVGALPGLAWMQFAARLGEMFLASSMVIPQRLLLMAQAGNTPSAADQREMWRMGSEKVRAFTDANQRAALAWAAAWPGLAWRPTQLRAWTDAMARVSTQALAPIHATA